jgi:hypothetical protein
MWDHSQRLVISPDNRSRNGLVRRRYHEPAHCDIGVVVVMPKCPVSTSTSGPGSPGERLELFPETEADQVADLVDPRGASGRVIATMRLHGAFCFGSQCLSERLEPMEPELGVRG